MRGQQSFLKSGRLNGASELVYKGKFVLDTFEDGVAYLHVHMPAYAQMFASPAVKRDANGGTSVAWYGEASGAIRKWDDVDETTKTRIAGILSSLVRSVSKWAEDPDDDMAQILLLWLHVLSVREDLLVVDGGPVLTNWGIVPEAIADDQAAIWNHFETGLGQFVKDEAETVQRHRPLGNIAAVQSSSADARQATATAASPGSVPAMPAAAEPRAAPGSAGVTAVAIACIVAFLVVLLLLIPGVLLYATAQKDLVLTDDALAETEAVLRQRISQLRALNDGAVCKAPVGAGVSGSVLSLPPSLSLPASMVPGASASAAPSNQSPGGPGTDPDISGLIPVSPSTLAPQGQQNASDIVDLLEKSVVLVLASGSGSMVQTGSGFFISPYQIVTNRHVVEGALPDSIQVTNTQLGGTRTAKVVSMTQNSDIGSPDFALLTIEGTPSSFNLEVTDAAAKGENVLAAGFPSFFTQDDSQFEALMQGDQSAVPGLVVTQGISPSSRAGKQASLSFCTAQIYPEATAAAR